MKIWYIAGEAFTDIDDAVEATVGLIGQSELAIHESELADSHSIVFKEARADLQNMCEGDVHDFFGVQITVGSL